MAKNGGLGGGNKGSALGGALGGIAAGAAAGLPGMVIGGLGGAVSSLFNNKKKQDQHQLELQNKLNEQAAATNYKYGEWAAKNAYNRQREMYDYTYGKEGIEGQIDAWKRSGFNPALAMDGGGGNAGQIVGGMMGETGGAVAGQAPQGTDRQMVATQQMRTQLEMMMMKQQMELMSAQTAKTGAEAEKIKGIDTEEGRSRTALNWEHVENENVRREGMRIDNAIGQVEKNIAEATESGQIERIGYEVESALRQMELLHESAIKAARENSLGEETYREQADTIVANLENILYDTGLKAAQIAATNANRKLSEAEIGRIEAEIGMMIKRYNMDNIMNQWSMIMDTANLEYQDSFKTRDNITSIVGGIISVGASLGGGYMIGKGMRRPRVTQSRTYNRNNVETGTRRVTRSHYE